MYVCIHSQMMHSVCDAGAIDLNPNSEKIR